MSVREADHGWPAQRYGDAVNSPAPRGAPTSAGLRRDMEVLRELASEECLRRGGLGVVRIAVRLGREKSQVSRALRALEGEGLVERDPRTRSYHLGWGLFTLAARGVEARLVLAASAHLHRLADEQNADVRLCVLIGREVLTLISMPAVKVGGAETPSQTPCGPVLALDWPESAIKNLFGLGPLEHHDLLASCAEARERGYAHSPGSALEPARYAAPVRDLRGVVLAAIQLAPRDGRESATDSTSAGKAVAGAASDLSADLGFEGPTPPRS
jgi:IclR family transcriptional regulator, KDG regulon repressor